MSRPSERSWVVTKQTGATSRQAPTWSPPASTPHNPNAIISTPPPTRQPAATPKLPRIIPPNTQTMAERELTDLLKQLHQTLQSKKYQQAGQLLSRAKVALLGLNALIPTEQTPPKHLHLARETLELGAVISIRLKDPVSFTRYFQQLQPVYSLRRPAPTERRQCKQDYRLVSATVAQRWRLCGVPHAVGDARGSGRAGRAGSRG